MDTRAIGAVLVLLRLLPSLILPVVHDILGPLGFVQGAAKRHLTPVAGGNSFLGTVTVSSVDSPVPKGSWSTLRCVLGQGRGQYRGLR